MVATEGEKIMRAVLTDDFEAACTKKYGRAYEAAAGGPWSRAIAARLDELRGGEFKAEDIDRLQAGIGGGVSGLAIAHRSADEGLLTPADFDYFATMGIEVGSDRYLAFVAERAKERAGK